jgi:hypothetical protein
MRRQSILSGWNFNACKSSRDVHQWLGFRKVATWSWLLLQVAEFSVKCLRSMFTEF